MSQELSYSVRQAIIGDLDLLVPLFDAYRVFYQNPSDPALARAFLRDRFEHNQSVVFLAVDEAGEALGFAQLYPSFSSGAAKRVFILNDLYVMGAARRRGVGAQLMRACAGFARAAGAVRLTLMTAKSNLVAQGLYESEGWARDTTYFTYNLSLTA